MYLYRWGSCLETTGFWKLALWGDWLECIELGCMLLTTNPAIFEQGFIPICLFKKWLLCYQHNKNFRAWISEHCGYALVRLLLKCASLISGSKYGRHREQHKWYLILHRYAGSLVRTQCSWADESPHQRFMPGTPWILYCLAGIMLSSNALRAQILSNLYPWSPLLIHWNSIKERKSRSREIISSCRK